MQRASAITVAEEIVDLSSILDEVFKKQNDIDKQVEIAKQDLEKVKLEHNNEKKEYEGILRNKRNSEMQLNSLKESIADTMTSVQRLHKKIESISFATGDKQFQQAKASLILSHEMVHHNKYYQIMEKYNDNKLLSTASMCDEIVKKKRETLYTRKKLLENKIAENRRQINTNIQTETKLKEEILILRLTCGFHGAATGHPPAPTTSLCQHSRGGCGGCSCMHKSTMGPSPRQSTTACPMVSH